MRKVTMKEEEKTKALISDLEQKFNENTSNLSGKVNNLNLQIENTKNSL